MIELPQTNDLFVFLIVVKNKSFIKAADELGFSRSYISKRIQVLEETLNCQLLHRSTRAIELTNQGEKVYLWAQEILLDVRKMSEDLTDSSDDPQGNLTITSSLGFGRQHIAPLLSDFVKKYPKVSIRFDTIDKMQDLVAQHVDLDIHIGNHISPNLIAKKIANNNRILCASPDYLAKNGTPEVLEDLLQHSCLVIQERDSAYAIWKLNSDNGEQQIKVSGHLSSNNGELVRYWALSGQGIMLRSTWDIGHELEAGNLVQVLPEYRQDADIWAIYPTRLSNSARLKACVNFLEQEIPKRLGFMI
ncbi:LysR family transcriptional regulator [Ignatzschineria rhizosphaerae]|uniref:LysR family transcriptional regulator n=1 Tax=Ignatzschineria rhizosphaerae TaxID=2923279 RepID=A0ABY3X815_9GAMM|nr:LysR family transcriptional regulator [Ignatzschineria rhizosphaerae]UNM96900.1 LysR family transcriptional regulator [Ignatzschineria rhizosphaerae]